MSINPQSTPRYRFGVFEADASTGELRRHGIRIKLNAQPFQVLCLLLARPGQVLTRDEIARELWPDGTFVDFDHGVNSAVNRIREALGDTASNPRFVETLARRGYRFLAPVEPIGSPVEPIGSPVEPIGSPAPSESVPTPPVKIPLTQAPPAPELQSRFLATPDDLPPTSHPVVQTLFLLLQAMYLSFYIGALANLAEIGDLVSTLSRSTEILTVLLVTAAVLIPVRLFLLCGVVFHAPGMRGKILRIWNGLLIADLLWSLAPFLLLHHFSFGLALSCTAILIYSPFAQRALVLMGAGGADPTTR